MIFGILPRFQILFAEYGKALPAPTQFVLDVGDVYAANWPFMLGGVVLVGMAFFAWVRTTEGRHHLRPPEAAACRCSAI